LLSLLHKTRAAARTARYIRLWMADARGRWFHGCGNGRILGCGVELPGNYGDFNVVVRTRRNAEPPVYTYVHPAAGDSICRKSLRERAFHHIKVMYVRFITMEQIRRMFDCGQAAGEHEVRPIDTNKAMGAACAGKPKPLTPHPLYFVPTSPWSVT
jgi:hypothetical protein